MAETGLFVLDAEDAGSTPWQFDSVVNVISEQAAAKNNGNAGWRVNFDGVVTTGYGIKAYAFSGGDYYARSYIFLPTGFDIGGNYGLCRLGGQFRYSASPCAFWGVKSAGTGTPAQWYAAIGNNSNIVYAAAAVTLNTWHYVEIHLHPHATAAYVDLWVDGVGPVTKSDVAFGDTPSAYWAGCTLSDYTPSNGQYYYLDDVVGKNTYIGAYAAGGHPAMKRFGGVPHAAINRGVW
jgi:hypothetical protein